MLEILEEAEQGRWLTQKRSNARGNAMMKEIEAIEKRFINIIEKYNLLEVYSVQHEPEKTTLTLCNLWRFTKHTGQRNIVLHEFSIFNEAWHERNNQEIVWHRGDMFEKNFHEAQELPWPNIFCFTIKNDVQFTHDLAECILYRVFHHTGLTVGESGSIDLGKWRELVWRYVERMSPSYSGKIRHILWENILDCNLMSALCTKHYGKPVLMRQYLEVLPYADDLLRIAKESRNFLPMLNTIPAHKWKQHDLLRNEVLQKAHPHFNDLTAENMRWLRKAPCSILNNIWYWKQLPDLLNLLANIQSGDRFPVIILRRIIRNAGRPLAIDGITGHTVELQRIYRLFARNCQTYLRQNGWKPLRSYLKKSSELAEIIDWYLAEGRQRGLPDSNATWNSIKRHSEQWHAQFRRDDTPNQQDAVIENASWISLLHETDINGVHVVPLESSEALRLEGKEMQHCVGSYTRQCLTGARIFSLRNMHGERSTLAIRESGGRWSIEQHHSFLNRSVPAAIQKVAYEICRQYTLLEKNFPIASRFAEAGNPKTPPDRLQQLADDPHDEVREYVAKNPNTPPNVLAVLVEDMNHDMQQAALKVFQKRQ